MNKFAILVLLTIIFTGCKKLTDLFTDKDVVHSLVADDKTVLKKGDTLVYRSNLNNVARYSVLKKFTGTFWVSISKKDGETSPPFERWEFESSLLDTIGRELTKSQLNIIDRSSEISYPIWTYSSYSNYPDFIAIKNYAQGSTFPGTGTLSTNWYDIPRMDYQKSSSLIILNRDFKSVIFYDLDTSLISTPGRHVVTFYCNSQNGLLGFRCSNGEIFELVK